MRRICVFCGSSGGHDGRHVEAARSLGREIAVRGLGLVYGGASVGLMGALADATLDAGGHVTGVLPSALASRELAHARLPDLRIVPTMHERKALMADLADAFVTLPGGMGTLDETFEILTWAQLGIHAKPVGLLDVGGYYGPLLTFLNHAVAHGFVQAEHCALIEIDADPARLMDRLLHKARLPARRGLDPDAR